MCWWHYCTKGIPCKRGTKDSWPLPPVGVGPYSYNHYTLRIRHELLKPVLLGWEKFEVPSKALCYKTDNPWLWLCRQCQYLRYYTDLDLRYFFLILVGTTNQNEHSSPFPLNQPFLKLTLTSTLVMYCHNFSVSKRNIWIKWNVKTVIWKPKLTDCKVLKIAYMTSN